MAMQMLELCGPLDSHLWNRRWPASVRALAALMLAPVLVLAMGIGLVVAAADWQTLRLGEATFQAPKDWKIVRRTREREFTLKSPDGVYDLRVEWWLPDEPLLGFSDVVWHRKTTVAGQPALMIFSRGPQTQTLQVALDKLRQDGRQLLIVLEAQGIDISKGSPMLDEILSRLSLAGGQQGKSMPPSGMGSAVRAPQPPSPRQPLATQPSQTPRTSDMASHEDGISALSVRYPSTWSRSTGDRDGLAILTLLPPEKQGLVLVVAARANKGRRAAEVLAAYEEQYYQDYVVPDSIEGDGDTRVGSVSGRFVDMLAQIYPVEGVRLGFTDGRSWLFKAEAEPVSYIVAVVHARDASADAVRALKDVASRVVLGASPHQMAAQTPSRPTAESDGRPDVADVPTPGLAGAGGRATSPSDSGPVTPPSNAFAPQAGARSLEQTFGRHCRRVEAAEWRHPVADALAAKGRSELMWVLLCQSGRYPVVGVTFELDPQGATSDFFNPLYLDLLKANGRRPLALVAIGDNVALKLAPAADGGFDLDVSEVTDAESPAQTGQPGQ